ncbi:unnamed protein product, partial [Allacma fusca]
DHLTYECTDDSSNRLPPQAKKSNGTTFLIP